MARPWSRTEVLAIALLALGTVSVGLWQLRRAPGPGLDCDPAQVRVGPDGVASCGEGQLPAAAARLTLGAKLDLNRASADDLAAIDGVGPVLAKALVEARARVGPFTDWDQVDKVTGVGPARLKTLQAVTELKP